MPMTIVNVPGGHLFAIDEGSGPPIVLLHAGVADFRAWDAMVDPLTSAGYRVVRFDTRGYGASTTEDVEFSHRADVLAVLASLGIGRAALVGNSRGGMIAFDTAIQSPEHVVAVVGVAAGLGGFEVEPTPEEARIFEAYRAVDTAEPFDVDALTDFETQVWLDGPGQPSDRVSPDLHDAFRAMAGPLNEPGRVRGHEIPLEPPPTTAWQSCAAPSSPSPGRSTSPMSSRPRAASSPPLPMRGRSCGMTSRTWSAWNDRTGWPGRSSSFSPRSNAGDDVH